MKSFLIRIPILLIYSRFLLGFVVVFLSLVQPAEFRFIIVGIMVCATISDIFDGIIARKLNISTQKLRRLDSSVDQVFWICALVGTVFICEDFFLSNYKKILILLIFEAITYLVSFIRFKKEVATHAILSKLWTLTILAALIQVVLTCNSRLIFNICIYVGIATRLEIIAMLLVIKEWTNDIPTLYHAFLLRKGREIKRNRFLNG